MIGRWDRGLHTLVGLLRDPIGATAVEFALIAPVMIAVYFGAVEISSGFAVNRQVSLVTSTAASLVAKQSTITTSQMSDYLSASTAIMSPYSATGITVTVSCLSITSGKATVSWSKTLNGTARAAGSTVSVPTAVSGNSKLLLSEVSYPYTPVVGYYITGSLTLSGTIYTTPRLTTAPTYNGTAC